MVDTKVSDFYDEFSAFQEKIAYNERHFLMLDKLLELELRKDSNVLELGCGIGVISSLILRVIKKGRLTAVDISPKSIEIARRNNPSENAVFEAADITVYDPGETGFDFVTLFDVLEHVPVESHASLFSMIADYLSEDGKLLINIPNPEFLQYIHDNNPEQLQIIDQPLSIARIVSETESCGFVLRQFENYDLWQKNESIFMWFELKKTFRKHETEAPRQSLLRRFQNKFEIYW